MLVSFTILCLIVWNCVCRKVINLNVFFIQSSLDLSEFAKAAKKKLQSVRHFCVSSLIRLLLGCLESKPEILLCFVPAK